MIKKFTVSNFKGFKEDFVFDLSDPNRYSFNENCVKNDVVNNAIIYGKNGVGKSNLGFAMFDIVKNLTDKETSSELYKNYLNVHYLKDSAKFKYEFLIDEIEVIYEYQKKDYDTIIFEKFTIDNNLFAFIDKRSGEIEINFKGTEHLNKNINENISILKYIKNNAVLENCKASLVFHHFFEFIEGMLFFRSLETTMYIGLENGSKRIDSDIIDNGNLKNFEEFLNKAGIGFKLTLIKDSIGKHSIGLDFGEYALPFFEVASSGTIALSLFYFWLQRIKRKESNVRFVFVDEFDAFYHHELSESIVEELKKTGIQFVLTTHNTSIMTNDLLRPDCYFLMNKEQIKPLSQATDRELREAHNLEKMYIANSFSLE